VNIEFELKNIVFKVLNRTLLPAEEKSNFNLLEDWDSLAHMQIILLCEDKFTIEFSFTELSELVSYETLLQKLIEKI
jgi:acyl carrier protein